MTRGKESGIRWYKSDNKDNPRKPYIDKAGMFYTTDGRMCYASEIEKQKEQKPEWDNEDERIRNEILEYFTITRGRDFVANPERQKWISYIERQKKESRKLSSDYSILSQKEAENIMVEFMSSHKFPEIKEEQKSEWSKEDIERYLSCLQRLGTGNPDQPETINSKWFKEHCYPQPKSHWKPTKEQIRVFFKAIPVNLMPEELAIYQSLYKDIEKLM